MNQNSVSNPDQGEPLPEAMPFNTCLSIAGSRVDADKQLLTWRMGLVPGADNPRSRFSGGGVGSSTISVTDRGQGGCVRPVAGGRGGDLRMVAVGGAPTGAIQDCSGRRENSTYCQSIHGGLPALLFEGQVSKTPGRIRCLIRGCIGHVFATTAWSGRYRRQLGVRVDAPVWDRDGAGSTTPLGPPSWGSVYYN